MGSSIQNHCKPSNGCSSCLVNGEWKLCIFGERHSQRHIKTCSFWKFDEFCDNVKAQISANCKPAEVDPIEEPEQKTAWKSYELKNTHKGKGEIIKTNRGI